MTFCYFCESMSNPLHVGILASTNGTILPAILESELPDVIFSVLVTNRAGCGAQQKAAAAAIPTIAIESSGKSREEWDAACVNVLHKYQVDLVILVGFMQILSGEFIRTFPGRILNVHPSLLPKFAGGMNLDVHAAVLEAGEKKTGATIHLVTEDLDAGPIVLQQGIPIRPDDTVESIKSRVQQLEGRLYPQAIEMMQQRLQSH